jgi:uncharacterized membrane protein YhiD involved in acid resistance
MLLGFKANDFAKTFGVATFALVCIAAGLSGYRLSKYSRFVAGTSWSDTVIWPQVVVGVAALAVAAIFARRANRTIPSRNQ